MNGVLRLLDRPIAYHRAFVTLTGSVPASVMLSQAIYWHQRTSDAEKWFYKTQDEWQGETGLTRAEQEKARERLRCTSFWKEERRGLPAKLFYRVDEKELENALLGIARKVTLEDVLQECANTLTGLSKAGYMRAKKAGVPHDYVDYSEVLSEKGMVCGLCSKAIILPPGKKAECLAFDHITPINKGGAHSKENLQPTHAGCNTQKGDSLECLPKTNKSAYTKQTRTLTLSRQVRLGKADIHTETTSETTTKTTTERGKRTDLNSTHKPAARTPQQAPPFEDFSENSDALEPLKREIGKACGIRKSPDFRTDDQLSTQAHILKAQGVTPEQIREAVKANPSKVFKLKFFAEDILGLHAVTWRAAEPEPEDLRTCKADNCVGGTVREWLESGKYRDRQCPECKGKGKVPVQIRARQEEAARRRAAANVDQLLSF